MDLQLPFTEIPLLHEWDSLRFEKDFRHNLHIDNENIVNFHISHEIHTILWNIVRAKMID